MERFELCIIGAGTAGFTAAETARAAGRSVVLVSRPGDLGGTCILRGCMPAKTLLSSTQALGNVEKAEELGIERGDVHIDVPAIIARKRELVDYFSEDRVRDLETFPLRRGEARFVARDAIDVDGMRLEAERFIVATGSQVIAPDIPGLGDCGFITSDRVLEMKRTPKAVAVIGGGPIGCEFSQYFARLGARVILFQDGPELLRKEDADVGASVRSFLEHDGVEVVLDAAIEKCSCDPGGRTVTYRRGNGPEQSVGVSEILLATGRKPDLASLHLQVAGIERDGDGIGVDRYLRTSNPAVYAAGDVLGRRCLVHVAAYAGKLAAFNAFAEAPRDAEFDRFEAHGVYTQPQIAVAGLTEAECRRRNLPIRVERHPFGDVGKALVSNTAEGFVKMLALPDGHIVGVAVVGDEAVELIGQAVAFIDRGCTVEDVASAPYLHPTMSEIFGRVAERLVDGIRPADK